MAAGKIVATVSVLLLITARSMAQTSTADSDAIRDMLFSLCIGEGTMNPPRTIEAMRARSASCLDRSQLSLPRLIERGMGRETGRAWDIVAEFCAESPGSRPQPRLLPAKLGATKSGQCALYSQKAAQMLMPLIDYVHTQRGANPRAAILLTLNGAAGAAAKERLATLGFECSTASSPSECDLGIGIICWHAVATGRIYGDCLGGYTFTVPLLDRPLREDDIRIVGASP